MKSIHTKLNEALEALDKAGKRKQYNEKVQPPMTAETRLNLAEAILGNKSTPTKESASPLKLEDIEESKRDYAILFGVEPKAATTNKESAAPIVKHNGRADNWNENDPLRRADGAPVQMTETTPKDICAKGDKAMFDGLLKLGKITEAEHAKLVGKKPAGYEVLSEAQRKEFDFCLRIGITEADAFRVVGAKRSNLTEVSR